MKNVLKLPVSYFAYLFVVTNDKNTLFIRELEDLREIEIKTQIDSFRDGKYQEGKENSRDEVTHVLSHTLVLRLLVRGTWMDSSLHFIQHRCNWV